MFDISFAELMLIAVVALLVIGPDRLPKVARTLGAYTGRLQRYVSQVKEEVNRELNFAELQEMQRELQSGVDETKASIQAGFDQAKQAVEAVEHSITEKVDAGTDTIAQKKTPAKKAVTQKTMAKKTANSKKSTIKRKVSKAKPKQSVESAK